MTKTKKVMGFVTIVGIVGFTAYSIKVYKDRKKAEEDAMSAEEAREAVEAYREAKEEREYQESLKNREDHISWSEDLSTEDEEEEPEESEFDKYEVDYEEEPEEDFNPDVGFMFDGIRRENWKVPLAETMTEEDKILNYEPSSNEARNQYIRMMLAEWLPTEDAYLTMLKLFEFPFEPTNDGDWDLKTKIIDQRVQFFGFGSRWANEVTFAEVILYYVELAEFNLGKDKRHWMDEILFVNEFDTLAPSHEIDDMIKSLNDHKFFNDQTDTFGLFGLTREEMDAAIDVASRNIENAVTYDIEFNKMLESHLY